MVVLSSIFIFIPHIGNQKCQVKTLHVYVTLEEQELHVSDPS